MTAVGESRDDERVNAARARAVSAARAGCTSDVHPVDRAGRVQESELQVGDVLAGRYTLLSTLGEGGMGDVWLAHNPTLDMQVALKVLRVDASRPEVRAEMSKRLLQEARATAKLGHPAIVRIIDFGETPAGSGFYVMELLEGEDLYALIERHGHLSAVKAVRTLLPIASALVAAHAKRIVHRDLKPENIFLARDPELNTVQPKLIDFGVAKLRMGNERITVAGAVMGSPGYMAPEQARGDDDVDERADVWGFCVVLYETISGRLPFDGKNFFALMHSIIEDEPAPLAQTAGADDVLASIIQRGLAKDPAKRWQSMREVGSALAGWLLQHGVMDDICGTQLSSGWLRAETLNGFPLQDPFVSAAIPGHLIDEARRARADMPTVAPLVATSQRESTLPRPAVLRSRAIAIAAIVLGVGGGIALGALALRGPAQAAQMPETAGELSFASTAETTAPTIPPPALPTSPAVSSQPLEPVVPLAQPHSARPVPPRQGARPMPRSNASVVLPQPKASTADARNAGGTESARPSAVLKNPF